MLIIFTIIFLCHNVAHWTFTRWITLNHENTSDSLRRHSNGKKKTAPRWMTSVHESKKLEMLQKSKRSTDNFGERQSSFTVSFSPEEMVNTYRMSEFRAEGLWNSPPLPPSPHFYSRWVWSPGNKHALRVVSVLSLFFVPKDRMNGHCHWCVNPCLSELLWLRNSHISLHFIFWVRKKMLRKSQGGQILFFLLMLIE